MLKTPSPGQVKSDQKMMQSSLSLDFKFFQALGVIQRERARRPLEYRQW
jgi:hypothetical protein